MGATTSKKDQPILNPSRLEVGLIYKKQIGIGKDGYKSDKCKKLTRKQKCKNGYKLEFGKEKIDNCARYNKKRLTFKRCTNKS
jgi:hypothetical protein